MKVFAWGVCNDDTGHTNAGTSGDLKTTNFSLLLFGGKGSVRSLKVAV